MLDRYERDVVNVIPIHLLQSLICDLLRLGKSPRGRVTRTLRIGDFWYNGGDMRILHLNVLYPPNVRGGAERFVAALAQEQARRGHDVGVVTLTRTPEPPQQENGVSVFRIGHGSLFWFEEWEKHYAPVRYANKFLASWNPITLRRVRRAIETFRPDVVNSHCMVAFAVDSWKAAAERDIPVVHALHEFNLVCRNTNAFRNGQMCTSVCLACRINEPKRWLSKYVSAVIGVSGDVLQRHLDFGFFGHIPAERRSVIWSMSPVPRRARPQRSVDAPFTIGFIGRIIPEKGLETLFEAITKLPRGGWRLLIAGKVFPPLDAAELKDRVANLPVEWLGVVPAADFYPEIDLLVVPALWADPGPLVVHEAFANGVPVIGARIGGIADFVEPGVTGWLYTPGDVAALYALLAARICAGRGALPKETAFESFMSETTPQCVAQRYEDVYRKTMNAILT
jgi:glycosyltransferase involved in cell wall biosynthesis